MAEDKESIRALALSLGADLCGFAAADDFADAPEGFRPTDIWAGCRSVAVVACRLPRGLAGVPPRIHYAHGNDLALARVDQVCQKLALALEDCGITAVPLPCDGPYDDWDDAQLRGRGALSMRHAAVKAGLGTLGKNTLLLNARYGNWINLGAVLLNAPLESDPPAEPLCRPGCRLCLKSCPTGALDGVTVNQAACRPHTYGTNARGFGVVNCNRCRVVCPMAMGAEGARR